MGQIFHALFGGGGGSKPAQQQAPAPAAAPTSAQGSKAAVTGSSTAPGANQQAYWQQLLSGTGQIGPGGQLPESVQANIDRQASLG